MANKDLTRDNLHSTPSIHALGSICATQLIQHGQVTLWITPTGTVELIDPEEVSFSAHFPHDKLDALAEEDAIRLLLQANILEEDIKTYLIGRENRLKK